MRRWLYLTKPFSNGIQTLRPHISVRAFNMSSHLCIQTLQSIEDNLWRHKVTESGNILINQNSETGLKPESIKDKIVTFMTPNLTRNILKKGYEKDLAELGSLLGQIENIDEFKTTKRFLMRKLGDKYSFFVQNLINSYPNDKYMRNVIRMFMSRKVGSVQLVAFLNVMNSVFVSKKLSVTEKIDQSYWLINGQCNLFPEFYNKKTITLSNYMHQWYLNYLEPEQYSDHYKFLINSNVNLSSSKYIHKLRSKMLNQGQQNLKLISFQYFLEKDDTKDVFIKKFIKLYDFISIIQIFSLLVKKNDFRFIEYYFASLLKSLEDIKVQSKNELLIKFNNLLLYFLLKQNNVSMFLQVFQYQIKLINLIEGFDPIVKKKICCKPLHMCLVLLRKNGYQEEVFQSFSTFHQLCSNSTRKDRAFKNLLMQELIDIILSFNDPKLVLSYIMSMYHTPNSAKLLNELGLWGIIMHHKRTLLSDTQLKKDFNSIGRFLPASQIVKTIPPMGIIQKLYQSLLENKYHNAINNEYKSLIIYLFEKLKNADISKIYDSTVILSLLLSSLRKNLREDKLAINLLLEYFEGRKPSEMIRYLHYKRTPFAAALYNNKHITSSQMESIKRLMEENKCPMTFEIYSTLIFHHLKLQQVYEAYAYYKKLLDDGFSVKHHFLIEAAKKYDWELPVGYIPELTEIENSSSPVTDSDHVGPDKSFSQQDQSWEEALSDDFEDDQVLHDLWETLGSTVAQLK